MITVVVLVAALVIATVHLFVSKRPRTAPRVIDLYLLYLLVVGVGIGPLFGGLGHLFMADKVAEQLGWPTGSPFQTEVGLYDLAFGVLGICCIWFRGLWWYAVVVGWAIFSFGAGINHIVDVAGKGNGAALDAGSGASDLIVPALLILLLLVRRRMRERAQLQVEVGA